MPQLIDRRSFLRLAGLGGGVTLLGCSAGSRSSERVPTPAARGGGALSSLVPPAGRRLVVVELPGGNDGLATAQPAESGRLRDLRPDLARSDAELLAVGGGLGLHPALVQLSARGVGVVAGIGSANPDLSHVEMQRRWAVGDPDGRATLTTGFLGRLCDALDEGAPATGVSIGAAASPALESESAGTLSLPEPDWLWWLDPTEDWAAPFRDGLAAMAVEVGDDPVGIALARRGLSDGLRVGRLTLPTDDVAAGSYPETSLGSQLALASALLAADVGVRIVHVVMDDDFDTHEGQADRQDQLLADLDAGLGAFLADLDRQDVGGSVLVATTSEFGRRPEQNASGGTDHGTASVALLAGAVNPGVIGELPSLTTLDDEDNLLATATLADYYATLAEGWLGVPAAEVLETPATPFPDVW